MIENPIHIKFSNSQNPNSEFDLLQLEDLLRKEFKDHTPFEYHLVEFYIIIFIEEGEGKHGIDLTDYNFEAGTLITIRKDQLHQFYANEKVKGTLLIFTDDFLVTYLEKLELLKSMQLFNELLGIPKIQLSKDEQEEINALLKRIRQEYFKVNDDYSLGIIRSELHILITKLYRIKSKLNLVINNRKYLSEFIDFQNLVEKNASQFTKVQDYAKMMAVSTKTLNNITKNIINKSAKEFIDDIYIKQIKRLLINTELTIKEIAFSSGFEESTNFYKYFKRKTKLTPEQFREQFK